ncbi:hypothetical protein [Virgibacillus kekensis]
MITLGMDEVKRFIAFMASIFGAVQQNWIRMSNFSLSFKNHI